MVLIFVKTAEGQTTSLDVKFDTTIKYLKKLISRSLEISRKKQKLIFGGQLLKDEETLNKYNITKECTIQLVITNIKKENISSSSSNSLNQSPINSKCNNNNNKIINDNNNNNTISPYLQFGDLILVQLIEAKELKKCDFWRQSSDPYVILAIDNFTTKSKIIKKNINPKFNEMFCFVVDNNDNKNNDDNKNKNKQDFIIGKNIKNKINKKIQKRVLRGAGSTDDDNDNNNEENGNAGNNMINRNGNKNKNINYIGSILSFLVFDHDRFTPDNFLGSTEINLSLIPYDSIIDLWIPLNHIETGHLHIRIRKCLLSSPMHRNIVFKLMSLERSITINDLQKNRISLDQLIGNEAWIYGKHDNLSNPALQHLVNVLLSETQNHHKLLWKSSSLKRIESILSSQHMLPTTGNPTCYVWISGLTKNNHLLLFNLIKQYLIPKRVYFLSHFALFEFKSIRDAVFIFITFQHKKFTTNNSRILLGFGRRLIFDKLFLSNVKMAGFLSIFSNKNKSNKWKLCWCFLKKNKLFCYQNLQSDKPSEIINLSNCLICFTSSQSIEIIDNNSSSSSSYFIYNHNKQEMLYWINLFEKIKDKYNDEIECDQDEDQDEDEKEEKESVLSLGDISIDDDQLLLSCGKCNEKHFLNHMLSPDFETCFFCISCLRDDILSKLNILHLKYLSSNYSISDFIELLHKDELSKYLDLKLCELLESGEHFIQCPSCSAKWEFVAGDNDNDSPDFNQEIGLNNKLLSDEAQRHYLSHRVCCRKCNKNFCRSCNVIPYHSGFNCKLYQMYLNADKCRFCSVALMPGEIGLNPPSEALKLVCNNTSCLEKRSFSCTKLHSKCKHPCNGTLNEKYCMSCIKPDCINKHYYIKQEPDDYCNICFTEELSEAPCIELDCGHIFHYQCIKKRLNIKQYYDSPNVNFGFARCPLCNIRISHNSLLKQELKQIQTLYRDFEQRAYDQLKQEYGITILNNDKEKNIEYALKRYAFYYCNICKNPYFGGLASCRDIAQGLNRSDFVCSPCSGIGQEKCKIHGKDYMVYKCKFCCNVATYFCWGNTHFCIDCHKKQENHDFMTTKSKKDLPKCPGPEKCPLRLEHPPNGEEFSIGCSLCRGSDQFFIKTSNPPQNNNN